MVREYTRESGVRSLERELAKVCRKVAKRVVAQGAETHIQVTSGNLHPLLGVPHFTEQRLEDTDEVGVVQGLAVSNAGGVVLNIEVAAVPGSGRLILTGRLGETLRGNARAGLSYIRSQADNLGLEQSSTPRPTSMCTTPGTLRTRMGPAPASPW